MPRSAVGKTGLSGNLKPSPERNIDDQGMDVGQRFPGPGDRPEREGREGDSQGMPVPNTSPNVQDAVIADIEARKEVGLYRYGTLLQVHNGRDMLLDAYEEALDLAVYLKGALMERDDV